MTLVVSFHDNSMDFQCAGRDSSTTFFFKKIKVRSTAASYKKKKHSYITRRSEHHYHTNNTHNKTLHRHNLGEEPKEATRELHRRHQCCATPNVAARCSPERQVELLHQGIITLKPRTHDRRSPCSSGASAEHSRRSVDGKH